MFDNQSPTSSVNLVRVRKVTKNFHRVHALQGIDLDIHEKEIFGLLGPNGAGKTTLVRILLGLIRPTSGEVRVFGINPEEDPLDVRAMTGYVMQETALDLYLSGRENVELQAALYNLPFSGIQGRVKEALSWSGLSDEADRLVLHYSGGMRRRLDLAMSTLNKPRLLILDEPTLGLDPYSRRQLWELVWRMKESGVSILLTTHYLEEANELCDRVCIIDFGKVVGLGTPEELKRKTVSEMHRLTIRFREPPVFERLELPLPAEVHGREAIFKGAPEQLWETVGILQQRYPGNITEIAYSQPTLDDVFLKLTGPKTGKVEPQLE